ncbi:DUF3306 domain-containing protein [Pseudoduganella rhizocola]|uniref:DUF3306 domain-containing protein n=1 Tax=Pseudoduganella rhizocola TaxID=3382643 RepID=UPI0038B5C078
MAAETFFARWSRRKTEAAAELAPADAEQPPAIEPEPLPAPTLEQLSALGHHDDLTPFVARGVDESVRRAAMKKLFTDPHFNVMDGLDIYIGDYSKPDPIPAAMLAALTHAKDLLNPLFRYVEEEQEKKEEAQAPSQEDDERPNQSM